MADLRRQIRGRAHHPRKIPNTWLGIFLGRVRPFELEPNLVGIE
jgi:hypothetical protein